MSEIHTDICILTTTDMHGKCWDIDITNDLPKPHNMLRVATAVESFRREYGAENVLLADNGDISDASPIASVNMDKFKQASPPAMALCLKEIGYDVFVPGNHEFDYAWDTMEALYRWLEENGTEVLAANICGNSSFTFKPYIVRTIQIGSNSTGDTSTYSSEDANANSSTGSSSEDAIANSSTGSSSEDAIANSSTCGTTTNDSTTGIIPTVASRGTAAGEHKIGIIGFGNTDIPKWDPAGNYPGMTFAHPGNEELSIVREAELLIPRMKDEGCEFIIAAYHGGLGDTEEELPAPTHPDPSPLTPLVNTENQGRRLIEETEDIDMLIAGHDHLSSYSNTYIRNKAGRNILVVNGGGENLTKTVIRFSEDEDGTLRAGILESSDIDLAGFSTDKKLESLINPYAAKAAEEIEKPVGEASGSWDLSKKHYTSQTNTMSLICAAMMDIASSFSGIKADICLTVVTSDEYAIRPGRIFMKDIYRMYRYSNQLAMIQMCGRDIREVLEETASDHLDMIEEDGRLKVHAHGDKYSHIIAGGLDFDYDLSAARGSRLRSLRFPDGRELDDSSIYNVVTITYLLGNRSSGLRKIRKKDAVWLQETSCGTRTIQQLIIEYIKKHCREEGAITPEALKWHWKVKTG